MITNETVSSKSAFLEVTEEKKWKMLFQYLKREQKIALLSFSYEYDEYDEYKKKKEIRSTLLSLLLCAA